VISLLWRGLADYATKVQADYIFGLSSVTTMDLRQIAALTIYFEEMGLMDHGFGITPLPRYWLRDLGEMLTECRSSRRDLREIEAKIPSLLKSYLKAGAKVCSFPVIDRQFKCTDFFTVLEMTKLSSAHGRRFAKT
jgi:putative hemolysin